MPKTMNPTQQQQIMQLALNDDQLEVLWLYGSQAKGTAHQHSDIDLAVAFKSKENDILARRLRPELLAIQWQQILGLAENKLSIVDINIAPIPLSMSVIDAATVLYCNNTSRLLKEQQRIMSLWEIDYLYHYNKFQPT